MYCWFSQRSFSGLNADADLLTSYNDLDNHMKGLAALDDEKQK